MFANTIQHETSVLSRHNVIIASRSSQYHLEPLTAGDFAPSFTLPVQQGVLNAGAGSLIGRESLVSLQDFIDYQQPLVVLFLGVASRALLNTQKLERLQEQIHRQGGRLLILTTLEPKYIKRHIKNSSLTVLHDQDNEIAESFGLFNEQNPLWQWVSGIDEEEATLPAFYVIAPDRSIAYHYVDFDFLLYRNNNFESLSFVSSLLDEVEYVSQQYHPQEVYKLVS